MKKILSFLNKYRVFIISFLLLLLNVLLFIFIHNLNVFTTKYYLLLFGVLVLLEGITTIFLFINKKVFTILGYLFTILLILFQIGAIYYVNVTDSFLNKSFNNDKREITITKSNPPTPWMNYLSNGTFHTMMSQAGGGVAFYKSPQIWRINHYKFFHVPTDRGGFYTYIKDGDNVWCPTAEPVKERPQKWQATHGMV